MDREEGEEVGGGRGDLCLETSVGFMDAFRSFHIY